MAMSPVTFNEAEEKIKKDKIIEVEQLMAQLNTTIQDASINATNKVERIRKLDETLPSTQVNINVIDRSD